MSFDIDKWNQAGCTVRCILELVRRKQGRTILPQQLVSDYLSDFPVWAIVPGVANTMLTCSLIEKLKLANVAKSFVDPDRIIKESKEKDYVGTLLFTERAVDPKDPARLNLDNHTMLALEFDEKYFKVWNPYQDGTARDDYPLSWKRWYQWYMHGLVLSTFPPV